MTDEQVPICSDLCEHCEYMECGDFICNVTGNVTIVDWKPLPCCCPEKRRLVNAKSKINQRHNRE